MGYRHKRYKRRPAKANLWNLTKGDLEFKRNNLDQKILDFSGKITELEIETANLQWQEQLQALQAEISFRIDQINQMFKPFIEPLASLLSIKTKYNESLDELNRLKVQKHGISQSLRENEDKKRRVLWLKNEIVKSLSEKKDIEKIIGRRNEEEARVIRKKQKIQNLKIAAARNAAEVRMQATQVKRKLRRDYDCPYCGGPLGENHHADHIYPVSKGGRSVERNMVNVCSPCNQKKADQTLIQFVKLHKLNWTLIEERLIRLNKDF